MSENQLGSLGDTTAMGNRLCCGGTWEPPKTHIEHPEAATAVAEWHKGL
ncbi:RIKEN cDNA 2310030G06, isoform CRA_a [Mus musculus]|nr:RIKEN cDNA 2310030G06, isoform CRA_a [Mus musculus]